MESFSYTPTVADTEMLHRFAGLVDDYEALAEFMSWVDPNWDEPDTEDAAEIRRRYTVFRDRMRFAAGWFGLMDDPEMIDLGQKAAR